MTARRSRHAVRHARRVMWRIFVLGSLAEMIVLGGIAAWAWVMTREWITGGP